MEKNDLLFIDTETTGVDEDDRLCQMGVQYYDGDTGWKNSEYFKPPLPISLEAMSVTHITNDKVKNKPTFEGSDMQLNLKKMADDNTIFVAHNADFDLKMLAKEGIVPKRHICTMKLAHDFDKKGDFGKYNLQYLRYKFDLQGLKDINPHDAMLDVIVLEALFKQVFVDKYTGDEMLEISSRPIRFKKWMFGKHKGETFEHVAKVDKDYLLWFRRQADVDENMLYTLNYWINK